MTQPAFAPSASPSRASCAKGSAHGQTAGLRKSLHSLATSFDSAPNEQLFFETEQEARRWVT